MKDDLEWKSSDQLQKEFKSIERTERILIGFLIIPAISVILYVLATFIFEQ